MRKELDLRNLNPKEGDLVLLTNKDFESRQPFLLVIFDKFLKEFETANHNAVELFGKKKYRFNAKKLAYIYQAMNFGKIQIPHMEYLIIGKNINYVPEGIYVGGQKIINALKEEKGYGIYATLFNEQISLTFPSTFQYVQQFLHIQQL